MPKRKFEKVGVVTSGGDAPGLNAALHAIVFSLYKSNIQTIGIHDGYEGLIDSKFEELHLYNVRNIMDEGGTILHTSRSKRFSNKRWRTKACQNLKKEGIDGLIIIGGNGSLSGAAVFAAECNIPIIGIPKTIDNDIYGTDYAIGFDTATNTIIDAIDKIKDTADSTSRAFIIEVMGRRAGFLGLHSGIAAGADAIIIPEVKTDVKKMLAYLEHTWRNGNRSMMIIITENAIKGGGLGLKSVIDKQYPQFDCRVSILGHIQRGGNPSALDRTLACSLAYHGVKSLLKGEKGVMVGTVNGKIKLTPLGQIVTHHHSIHKNMLGIAREFSFL